MLAVAVAALLAVPPQDPPPAAPPDTTAHAGLRVFLDCDFCDRDFLRTEITFVNYMRDRADAEVHVLVTRRNTGSGGDEFTLAFIGLRQFLDRGDTLHVTTPGTATEDEERRAIARMLRLGLLRYVARTPAAEHVEVRYTRPDSAAGARAQPRDRWNFWVFEIGVNGNADGEESYSSRSLGLGFEADRVTEQARVEIDLYGNNRRTRYVIDDTTTFTSTRESYSGEALVVRSFGQHWSAGGYGQARQETYRNLDLRSTILAVGEYSVFPYRESTRRKLQLRWGIGPEVSRYADTTIYLLTRESRLIHRAEVEYEVTQPWGEMSVESGFQQYFFDTSKLSLNTYANIEIRVVRGLSLDLYGGYSVIRDQLYLPAGDATTEEIIARQRQLATGYSYWGGVGLSFKFGAIYNNIVNPSFGN